MLIVTESAICRLDQMLKSHQVAELTAIRLICLDTEVVLVHDQERDGDMVFRCDHKPVLLVEGAVAGRLHGGVIDIVDGALEIRRPNPRKQQSN